MLELMAALVIFDIIVKIPDYLTVRRLRKAGWRGNLRDYYEWKRRR